VRSSRGLDQASVNQDRHLRARPRRWRRRCYGFHRLLHVFDFLMQFDDIMAMRTSSTWDRVPVISALILPLRHARREKRAFAFMLE
jgi:hypothetical protein